jgi:sarcosine oxidase subunit alpha
VDRVVVIPAGAHVVAPGVRRSLGFVTSSRWSPTVSGSIALALLEGGRSRHGQRVRLSDGVQDWVATVSAPVFVDPAGERLRG